MQEVCSLIQGCRPEFGGDGNVELVMDGMEDDQLWESTGEASLSNHEDSGSDEND